MPATVTAITPAHPEPQLIRILLAPGDPAGYPISHPYIDGLWLPVIGPSATALLRLVDRLAVTQPDVITITLEELGQRIGIGGRGASSRAARTIERLCSFRVIARTSAIEIVVPLRLPPLSDRQLDRLPPYITALDRQLRHDARTA